MQDWKEAPVDAMVLVLYRLSESLLAEINRGRAGLGDYSLRAGLTPVAIGNIFSMF